MTSTIRGYFAAALLLAASVACNRTDTIRIGVVPKALAHEFWIAVRAGVDDAAREAGVSIEWQGPSTEIEFSRQIEIVDAMINSRVDGLLLAPTEATALIGVVERAMREGIPVTIFDSGINTDRYVSFVASNNYEAGVTAARTLADLLDGAGKIVIVKMVAGSNSTMQREAGFEDTLAKDYPGIEVVDFKYCQSDRALALSVTENMLTAHPELDGMFASAEPATVGAAKALRNRERFDQVQFVGFDWTSTLEPDFRDGVVRALVVQDPYQIGYRGVETVLEALRGGTPSKRVDVECRVVTMDNLETPEIRALLRLDSASPSP